MDCPNCEERDMFELVSDRRNTVTYCMLCGTLDWRDVETGREVMHNVPLRVKRDSQKRKPKAERTERWKAKKSDMQ